MKLEELKKQKDPLKYLEEQLKKTKDKKLIKEIKLLIEKLKSIEKPSHNLEGLVRHAPRIPIEEEEPPKIETGSTDTIPAMALTVESRQSEDYGIKTGTADYNSSQEHIKNKLQESHQITSDGFRGAETDHLIDQKMGEYSIDEHKRYLPEEQPKYAEHEPEFEHVQKSDVGLTALEKQVKDKKFKPKYQ